MSIDSERIRCTGCDYETLEVYAPILIVYMLNNAQTVKTGRAVGWCYECDAYRDIENMDLECLRQQLAAKEEAAKDLRARLIQASKGLFSRFREASRKLQENMEWLERGCRELSRLLEIASERTSRPRCLTCWSERTAPISFDETGRSGDFIHKCGGQLQVVPDAKTPRFQFRDITYILDTEGRLLEERDD